MDAFAAALEGFALAEWLRYTRWPYAFVNAAHIFGICLLVGASVALDLRLMGLLKGVEPGSFYRALAPIAASGLVIAICTGILLFTVRATEYVRLELFFLKLALIAIAAAGAGAMHFVIHVERLSPVRQRLYGAVSLLLWLSVLVCGRLLAFV